MFCRLVRLTCTIQARAAHATAAAATWVTRCLRTARTAHLARVSSNATYAAATAAGLGWLLGLVPARDLAAALLAAAFGAYLNAFRQYGDTVARPRAPRNLA